MSDAMIGTREAAAFLGIAVKTLHAWTSEERIPFYRISPRKLGFNQAELQRWLDARKIPARGSVA